jgi:hypothetical protein
MIRDAARQLETLDLLTQICTTAVGQNLAATFAPLVKRVQVELLARMLTAKLLALAFILCRTEERSCYQLVHVQGVGVSAALIGDLCRDEANLLQLCYGAHDSPPAEVSVLGEEAIPRPALTRLVVGSVGQGIENGMVDAGVRHGSRLPILFQLDRGDSDFENGVCIVESHA